MPSSPVKPAGWFSGMTTGLNEADKNRCPFIIRKLTPIQMQTIDIDEVKAARAYFSDDEWIDLILTSTGMESSQFNKEFDGCKTEEFEPYFDKVL